MKAPFFSPFPFHFSSVSHGPYFLGDSGMDLFVFRVVLYPLIPVFFWKAESSPPLGTASISVLSPKSQLLACVPSPLPALEPERLSLKAESWMCTAPLVSSGLRGLSFW